VTKRLRTFARVALVALLSSAFGFSGRAIAQEAPAQRLPSAVLIYPLIDSDGFSRETRVELVNLSRSPQRVSCFYVEGAFCNEIGFQVSLTPNQPLSWLASHGYNQNSSAVPPFLGVGELKCAVLPSDPSVDSHNAIQGRAIVYGSDGQTIGYSAVGFQRLVDGEFTGELDLDGQTYAACPDEQHFAFLATDASSSSEIVLTPCTEDLENQIPTSGVVTILVVNEFEETLSASINVSCYARRRLEDVSSVFQRSTLGSETGHLIVRGAQTPMVTMLIDRFNAGAAPGTAGNEPFLKNGRAATIRFP
jgi:hypothetical protein